MNINSHGYGHYGYPTPRRYYPRPTQPQWQQNSTDIYVGGGNHFWNQRGRWFGGQGTRGYGINLNMRPGHQRGQDGVLVFDLNRDGKYDKRDVQNTNDLMKSATGNYDFNGDGRIDRAEARRGSRLRRQYQSMDRDRDGRLSTSELSRAGGKVWIDKSRGGGISNNELHSVWNLPGSNGRGGLFNSRKLDYVDPFSGHSRTSNNHFFRGPWTTFPSFPRWDSGFNPRPRYPLPIQPYKMY